MAKIRCMYCDAELLEDADTCPACGAPSHYRKQGGSTDLRKKFIVFFVLLVVVSVFFMLWLPR